MLIITRCQHNDPQIVERRVIAQAAANLIAVDAGHLNIEHHQIGHGNGDFRQRLFAAMGEIDLVAVHAQPHTHDVGDKFAIINDQDFLCHGVLPVHTTLRRKRSFSEG